MTNDHAGRAMEDEERREGMKRPQPLPKSTQISGQLKVPTVKKDAEKTDGNLAAVEQQTATLALHVSQCRGRLRELLRSNAAEEALVMQLEEKLKRGREREVRACEVLDGREERSTQGQTPSERERKSKQEKNAANDKLTSDMRAIESENAELGETLGGFEKYGTLLQALAVERTEVQEVPSDRHAQGSDGGPESSAGSQNHSQDANSKLDTDKSEHEEKLGLSFCGQLVNRVMELTEQCLSLIKSNMADEVVEELQQAIAVTLEKMQEGEEKLLLLVGNKRSRRDEEKATLVQLKTKVQIYTSLKAEERGDAVLDALGKKAKAVYRCCVDRRLTCLSTLERLASVEYRLSLLLQRVESIPEENLEALWQIKDSERRSRLREENLRLEREKQIERMKKCMQRSLSDAKKITGRKLMPRCIPIEQKITISSSKEVPAEDKLHAYLFTTEGTE